MLGGFSIYAVFLFSCQRSSSSSFSEEMMTLFENQINHFVLSNRERLTHLDISYMYTPSISGAQKNIFLTQLLKNILETSKSLQSIHLDGWQLSEEQKFLLAQRLSILEW